MDHLIKNTVHLHRRLLIMALRVLVLETISLPDKNQDIRNRVVLR